MSTETKFLGGILIGTVVLLLGAVFLLTRGQYQPKAVAGAATLQIDYSKGYKIGSDSAKVKLVEFSDFECPACLAFEPYLKNILSAYPNEVQFIYRHFPLPQHKSARKAAYFAEASSVQNKFWEMHDEIFATQTNWAKLADSSAFFMDLTKKLGLDEGKIKQALDDSYFKSKIDNDIADGQRLGINSTPTFFLNGTKLNLQKFDDLKMAVEQELKK